RALGAVVGGFDLPVGHEDEEVSSDRLDGRLKCSPRRMGWLEAEEAVEPALEVGEVGFQGRIGQVRAPPPEGACALEQALQGGREHAVALIDDVLDVADEMREAELMVAASPAGLAAEPIRQPHVGPPFSPRKVSTTALERW